MHGRPWWLLPALTILLVISSANRAWSEDGHVFLLQRRDSSVVLEPVTVAEGQTVVVPADPASGVIGMVFPPGPGVSGSIEQPQAGRVIVLRCTEGLLHSEVRDEGRAVSGYPDRPIEDLARFDSRVSVVGGDGLRAAFLVLGYRESIPDPGPVQNLFAGTPVPLGASDFIVTTDTYRRVTGEPVAGESEVELSGHAFLRVAGPDGRDAWFILDTGAAETVVTKAFLPDTARIVEAAMVEYSSAGRRLLDYAPSGATGPVTGVLGHVRLAELRAGGLRFDDVEAAVLPEIPNFFDRPVAGIIGLDLLRRGASVTIRYPAAGKGTGWLTLGPAPKSNDSDARVPFSMVSSHLVFPVHIGTLESFMILDSGAPGAVVDSAAALAAGLPAGASRTGHGIDGGGTTLTASRIGSLGLGSHELGDVACQIGALHAFRTLRDDKPIGLFGNALMACFDRLVIDFKERAIIFQGARNRP